MIIYLPTLDLLLPSQSFCPPPYCALCTSDTSCEYHDHAADEVVHRPQDVQRAVTEHSDPEGRRRDQVQNLIEYQSGAEVGGE